jgi:hypothetical protein
VALKFSEEEHTDIQQKIHILINLDWRELLLHFYQEPKDYIKDITEIEKLQEAWKVLKYFNDSASPSPLLCTKEDIE